MTTPCLSIVIPAYNRVGPLRLTLRCAARAAQAIAAEIILVDDGSDPPLAEVLSRTLDSPIVLLRQPNQGSMAARDAGLRAARGEYVLFLDSDDLVHPDKYSRQIAAMQAAGADLSYSDMAEYELSDAGDPVFRPGARLATAASLPEFFLRVQPVPHNPIYRRDYLLRHLTPPLVPLCRDYDPVGDVWIYYNLLPHPGSLVKVDAPLTAVGVHDETRFSRHWETLGFAALRLMEDFSSRCPDAPETEFARQLVGECAFDSWRRLPWDFPAEFQKRLLAIWRRAPRGPLGRLGGPGFTPLARLLGPVGAARVLRRLRGAPYAASRTLSDAELARLFATP